MLDESKFIFFDFFIGLTIILGHLNFIPLKKIMQYPDKIEINIGLAFFYKT